MAVKGCDAGAPEPAGTRKSLRVEGGGGGVSGEHAMIEAIAMPGVIRKANRERFLLCKLMGGWDNGSFLKAFRGSIPGREE